MASNKQHSQGSSRRFYILLLLAGFFLFAFPQNDSGVNLKNKVETLLNDNDIISANRLLNRNTSLDPEYVIEVLNLNLAKAKSEGDSEALAYTYLSIGNFWLMRTNNIKAYENFYQAEKLSRQNHFDWILALAMMNRSHLEPDIESRINLLREAIEMFGKLNDPVNLAKAHLNLGQVFSNYLRTDSLKNSNRGNDVSGNPPVFNPSYRDSAFSHYHIAGRLNDSISHPEIEASVNVHFAEWYKFEGDFIKAQEFFETASHFFGLANQAKGQIYCLIELADINVIKGEYPEAALKLEKCMEWAGRMGFNDYLSTVYNKFTILYEKTGQLEKALNYQRLYTQSLTQINEVISQDRIHSLNLEYALSEQNNLISSLNHKKQTNRLLMILISSAALLAIITSYLLVQNKRRKLQLIALQVEETRRLNEMKQNLMEADLARQQLEKDLLEEKVKVRTERIIMIANQINKLDTFLQSMSHDVKSLVNNPESNELAKKINDLKLSLSQSMYEQTNLRELQALSTETNQDFFFHIGQKYEGITRDDIKLLSFLVMNMASKEISGHFNISQESVNKKRYRLRQKLGIHQGKSFAEFYRETLEKLHG